MFTHVPVCERCWFDHRGKPPLAVVKVAAPERCHVCDRPTIAGIFVRVGDGDREWTPQDADPHEPAWSEDYAAGHAQGHGEGYEHGYSEGYDAALRDNGLGADVPDVRGVENVVETL